MTTWTRILLGGAAAIALMAATPALAQTVTPPASEPTVSADDPQDKDVVVIFGRAKEQIGAAKSASEGVVGYKDLSTRPISRAAELVEVIPGMIATEHSSGGKANQYFMRGFNLDHGTDFGGFIDGVPINQRSHPHMSGYLDLNFLMADLVERVEFKKGIQYAENGDYTAAGSASFVLYDKLPENYVQVRADAEGEYRLTAAGSWDVGDGTLLAAVSHEGGDGSFDLPADLKKNIVYLKYSQPVNFMGDAKLRSASSATRTTGSPPTRSRCARSRMARSAASASSIPPMAERAAATSPPPASNGITPASLATSRSPS